MNFIKQCKGKDIQNIPKAALEDEYLVSIKFDGNYCQIHKFGDSVQFFSSSGKEYFFKEVAAELISLNPGRDFILESEYVADSMGKLGDRKKSRLSRGSNLKWNEFWVFDILHLDSDLMLLDFNSRVKLLDSIKYPISFNRVNFQRMDFHHLEEYKNSIVNRNYEGIMCKSLKHKYKPGKRVNTAMKVKNRITVDLLCFDAETDNRGWVKTLSLKDNLGRTAKVRAGMLDEERRLGIGYYLNNIVEVEYETVSDVYNQAVFKGIRLDKRSML